MNKKLLFALFLIFFSFSVSALGITPGRTTIDYRPGEKVGGSLTIINSEHIDGDFSVQVQKDFSDLIELSETSFSMRADEESREISFSFVMPENLEPGTNIAEIVVARSPRESKESHAFVGATVAVVSQIVIDLPYPGKYAEFGFSVIDRNDGQVTLIIPVESRGELDLDAVGGVIDVFDSDGKKVGSVQTNELFLSSGQRGELVANWDSSDVAPGKYRASATITYDGKTAMLEKEFEIGKKRLNVESIEVNGFSLGGIAKFEILVSNQWSRPTQGVFAQMQVFDESRVKIADFQSQTYDIEQSSSTLVVAFWDTVGVEEGTYEASLFLRSGEFSEQQNLQLNVKKNEINIAGVGYVISNGGGSGSSLTIILIIVIVFLVLLNLSWFLFFRKKLKRR